MINNEIIAKWNKKYCISENYTIDNPVAVAIMNGQDTICEGLIRTYPIKTTQHYIQKLFSLDEGQIVIFNKFFAYPEHTYCFIEKTSPEEIYNLKQQLKQNEEEYCLLVLDVSRISETVCFHLDPNYKYGIYTKDNIPPTAIIEAYKMVD